MKKVYAIFSTALFVLGFAGSAFAIHAEIPSETQAAVGVGTTQITLGGEFRIRGWYYDNIGPVVGAANSKLPVKTNSAAWYDERVRLSLDAKVTPNVKGLVQLESGATNAKGASTDTFYWGHFDSKPTTLSILQAWIMYSGSGLLGLPAGVKIGHMPLALGSGAFFDHTKFGDDAIVLFANPSKAMEVDLLTIKLAGDGVPTTIPTFNNAVSTGGNFDNNADLDAYVGIATYKIDNNNTVGVNYTFLNLPKLDFSHQNFELAGNGNISGLGYKYSADIQFGKTSNALFGAGAGSRDFSGWAAAAGVNYMVDPVNIRASFAYGSGPTNDPGKDKQFENYLDSNQHFTLIYDYNLVTAAGRTLGGISNTTYYNLGFDVTPVKVIKASLDGYILRASEGNTFYKGAFYGGLSKDVGWEIDGRITYSIAKNLTYVADAGYMHAGGFYKDLNTKAGLNLEVKNPVVLKHAITLSF